MTYVFCDILWFFGIRIIIAVAVDGTDWSPNAGWVISCYWLYVCGHCFCIARDCWHGNNNETAAWWGRRVAGCGWDSFVLFDDLLDGGDCHLSRPFRVGFRVICLLMTCLTAAIAQRPVDGDDMRVEIVAVIILIVIVIVIIILLLLLLCW